VPLLLIFVFVMFCTLVAKLFSKNFPLIWSINKIIAGLCLLLSVAFASIVLTNNYFRSLPNVVFHETFGSDPPGDVKDLKFSSVLKGQVETNDLTFLASKETFDRIRGGCFAEIPEEEVSSEKYYPQDLIGARTRRYYRRLSWDVDKNIPAGCINRHPNSFIAYDEENGRAYIRWKMYW
jgi:hypothetical protein